MSSCLLCESPIYGLGLCRSHYEKDLRQRNPAYAQRQRDNSTQWQKDNDYRENPDNLIRRRRARTEKARERLASQLARQGGQCGLCGQSDKAAWHYDHDHETGQWRLVLCSKCNNGLGFFDDDPELLRQAADYIEKFRMDQAGPGTPFPDAAYVMVERVLVPKVKMSPRCAYPGCFRLQYDYLHTHTVEQCGECRRPEEHHPFIADVPEMC
jgi:hypothetical protein